MGVKVYCTHSRCRYPPGDQAVEIALTIIYGIGRSTSNEILGKANVNPDTRVRDLTEEEVNVCGRSLIKSM